MRTDPPEGVLIDATPHGCPYLPGRTAVLPTRWYSQDVRPPDFDALLACADRRVGRTMYRPECPDCQECQGIRVSTSALTPTRSQRRIWTKNEDLKVTAGPPVVDKLRLDLFNRHKLERDLASRTTSDREYAGWLVRSCVRTVETRYWAGDNPVGFVVAADGTEVKLEIGDGEIGDITVHFEPNPE